MDTVYYAAGALAAVGVLLLLMFSFQRKSPVYLDGKLVQDGSGMKIIYGFAAVALIFGAFALYTYRGSIFTDRDDLFYFGGLVLTMFFGMIVQVLYSAYREHRNFAVSKAQVILPLLFSIVIFSPIWSIATTSARGFFVFQAAFLNGFFWESLVTAASPPKPPPIT